jgi:RNA polymerase sigma-70 factor (ECF subfamily)
MVMMDAESELVESARKGSHEAFSQILRTHQSHVRGYLSRFIRNDDIVDDLAQETFLNSYRSLGAYKGESSLRTWLLSIARHMALRYLEDVRRRRAHESASLEPSLATWLLAHAQETSDLEGRHEKEVAALENCIKGLAPKSAALVSHFYYDGHRAADIARTSGKTEGSVWVALLRIRESLRHCVESRLGAPETV